VNLNERNHIMLTRRLNKGTKIYIAGCGGMLGQAVYRVFSGVGVVKATDIDVNEPWLEYADVRDYHAIEESIKKFMPDIIINLAAKTDMEECEREQENAWLTNALGTENIALLSEKLGVPYIYISTAGIFDGEQEFFNDFDVPNPLSIYAKSKYAGEVFTKQHVRKHYIVRPGWMMGGGPRKDKKFVNKIYNQIVNGAKQLNVVDDKFGTPTFTHDFARGLLKLAESDLYGVYNQVCGGSCSRFDVAVEFVRLLGLAEKIKINKVQSDFFQQEYFAPRPRSEKLVNMKLNARGLNVMRDWKTCLQEYSKEFIDDLNRSIADELKG
jgi:dTDP-4-dehydrorhamnose reductase